MPHYIADWSVTFEAADEQDARVQHQRLLEQSEAVDAEIDVVAQPALTFSPDEFPQTAPR